MAGDWVPIKERGCTGWSSLLFENKLCCCVYSWPSSSPHWLFQKRNKAHVKPPSPSYFIKFACVYWPGGLMDSMSIQVNGFLSVVVISVFNSWCRNHVFGALSSLFYVFFLLIFTSNWYFILLYVLWFIFDTKPSGWFKIPLIIH